MGGGVNAHICCSLEENLQIHRLFSKIIYIYIDKYDDIVYKYIDNPKKYGYIFQVNYEGKTKKTCQRTVG